MQTVALAAQGQADSKKNWDDFSILVICLGVIVVIGFGVGCIQTIREHLLSLVNWTLLE